MAHINIEIKARCTQPDAVKRVLTRMGARYEGRDHQIDTYFRVPQGRLKLREGNVENALIYYERDSIAGPKQSNVILFRTKPDPSLRQILEKCHPLLVIVDKQRDIYWVDNVKFHVDDVKGLGSFVEIEAIDYNGTIGREALLRQCMMYKERLGITDDSLLTDAYSDLVMAKSLRTS